jgi:hypothetical protein
MDVRYAPLSSRDGKVHPDDHRLAPEILKPSARAAARPDMIRPDEAARLWREHAATATSHAAGSPRRRMGQLACDALSYCAKSPR